MTNQDALTITLDQIRDLLKGLGIEPNTADLKSVHLDPGIITVTRFRRNSDGYMVVIPGADTVATEVTTIAVVGR